MSRSRTEECSYMRMNRARHQAKRLKHVQERREQKQAEEQAQRWLTVAQEQARDHAMFRLSMEHPARFVELCHEELETARSVREASAV